MNKLRDELSKVNSVLEFKDNDYLQMVIKESHRLMPLAQSFRKPDRDIPVKGTDYVIPKGSICLLSQVISSRNHKIFQDPDSFIPERWENPTREMLESTNPFALGKRRCPGRALASAELEVVAPFLMQNFHFSVAYDEGAYDTFPFIGYDKVRLQFTPLSQ